MFGCDMTVHASFLLRLTIAPDLVMHVTLGQYIETVNAELKTIKGLDLGNG